MANINLNITAQTQQAVNAIKSLTAAYRGLANQIERANKNAKQLAQTLNNMPNNPAGGGMLSRFRNWARNRFGGGKKPEKEDEKEAETPDPDGDKKKKGGTRSKGFGDHIKQMLSFNNVARTLAGTSRVLGTSFIFSGGALRGLGVGINVASSLFQSLTPVISQMGGALMALGPIGAVITAGLAALSLAVIGVVAQAGAFVAVLGVLTQKGFEFNQTMETTRIQIGTLVTQYKDLTVTQQNAAGEYQTVKSSVDQYTDAQLDNLTATERSMVMAKNQIQVMKNLEYSQVVAEEALKRLTVEAAQSPFTTQQLAAGFQSVYASLGEFNVTAEKAASLTVSLGRVASVAGVAAGNMASQFTLFLTGAGRITSPLARFAGQIGLNAKRMREYREELKKAKGDQEKTDAIMSRLIFRLSAFDKAGQMIAGSWAGIMSNMAESLDLFAGAVTKGLFESIRDAFLKVEKVEEDFGKTVKDAAGNEIKDAAGNAIKELEQAYILMDDRTKKSVKTDAKGVSIKVSESQIKEEMQKLEKTMGKEVDHIVAVAAMKSSGILTRIFKFDDKGNLIKDWKKLSDLFVGPFKNLAETIESILNNVGADGASLLDQFLTYVENIANAISSNQLTIEAIYAQAKAVLGVVWVLGEAILSIFGITGDVNGDLDWMSSILSAIAYTVNFIILTLMTLKIIFKIVWGLIKVVVLGLSVILGAIIWLITYVIQGGLAVVKMFKNFPGVIWNYVIRPLLQGISDVAAKLGEYVGKEWGFTVKGEVELDNAWESEAMTSARAELEKSIGNLYKMLGDNLLADLNSIGDAYATIERGMEATSRVPDAFKNERERQQGVIARYRKERPKELEKEIADAEAKLANRNLTPQQRAAYERDRDEAKSELAKMKTAGETELYRLANERKKKGPLVQEGDGKKTDEEGDDKGKGGEKTREEFLNISKDQLELLKAYYESYLNIFRSQLEAINTVLERQANILKRAVEDYKVGVIDAAHQQLEISMAGLLAQRDQAVREYETAELIRKREIDAIKTEAQIKKAERDREIAKEKDAVKVVNLKRKSAEEQFGFVTQVAKLEYEGISAKTKHATEMFKLTEQQKELVEAANADILKTARELGNQAINTISQLEELRGGDVTARGAKLIADSREDTLKWNIEVQNATERVAKAQQAVTEAGAGTNAELDKNLAMSKDQLRLLEEAKAANEALKKSKMVQLAIAQQQEIIDRKKLAFEQQLEGIQKRKDSGRISEQQAQQESLRAAQDLQEETRGAAQAMADLYEYYKDIGDLEGAERVRKQLEEWKNLTYVVNENAKAMRESFRDGFEGIFDAVQKDIKSVKDAVKNMADNILNTMQKMISKRMSDKLMTSLFGDGKDPNKGGKKGLFGDLFGDVYGKDGAPAEITGDAARGKVIIDELNTKSTAMAAVFDNATNLTKTFADVIAGANTRLNEVKTSLEDPATGLPKTSELFGELNSVLPNVIASMKSFRDAAAASNATGKNGQINIDPNDPNVGADGTPSGGARSGGRRASVSTPKGKYDKFIMEAANKYGIDPLLIQEIIRQESTFNPNATSNRGAVGLMQLMPGTARDMGVTNRKDPRQNIMGGTRYFKMLLDRYGGNVDKALAAYNAGMGNVDKYKGVPPFKETKEYVRKIGGRYRRLAGEGADGRLPVEGVEAETVEVKASKVEVKADSNGSTVTEANPKETADGGPSSLGGSNPSDLAPADNRVTGQAGDIDKGIPKPAVSGSEVASGLAAISSELAGLRQVAQQGVTATQSLSTSFTNFAFGTFTTLSATLTSALNPGSTISFAAGKINQYFDGSIKKIHEQFNELLALAKGPGDVKVDKVEVDPPKEETSEPVARAWGGYISGPGGPKDDLIPALLSNGEYVIQADAVKALGLDTLDKMNHAHKLLPKFNGGGGVGAAVLAFFKSIPTALKGFFTGNGFKSAMKGLGKAVFSDYGQLVLSSVIPMIAQRFGKKGAAIAKYLPLLLPIFGKAFNAKFGTKQAETGGDGTAATNLGNNPNARDVAEQYRNMQSDIHTMDESTFTRTYLSGSGMSYQDAFDMLSTGDLTSFSAVFSGKTKSTTRPRIVRKALGGAIRRFAKGGMAHLGDLPRFDGGTTTAKGSSGGGKGVGAVGQAGIMAAIQIGLALVSRLMRKKPKSDRAADPFGLNKETLTFYKKPIVSGSRKNLYYDDPKKPATEFGVGSASGAQAEQEAMNVFKRKALGGLITAANGGLIVRAAAGGFMTNQRLLESAPSVGTDLSLDVADLDGLIQNAQSMPQGVQVKNNITINTPDIHSFKKSKGTLERDLARITSRGARRRGPRY